MGNTISHIDYDGIGELYISGINAAIEGETNRFDRVITVCQDSIHDNVSNDQNYSWYCMSDGKPSGYGGISSFDMFEEAANELYDALRNDESVLIHCHCGVSRSVSVSAAALARLLDIDRTESLDTIHRYRPRDKYPDGNLMSHTSEYINMYTE